jgi:hypothetical protein
MKNRTEIVIGHRDQSIGEITNESSSEERFQNQTLRPILKFQNDLLIAIFLAYCVKQKSTFFKLSVNKKLEYIEQNIQRDMKFRDFLKGIIIGFFTIDEYEIYNLNASNLNKRLINMLIERLKSQVQLIDIQN